MLKVNSITLHIHFGLTAAPNCAVRRSEKDRLIVIGDTAGYIITDYSARITGQNLRCIGQ